MKIIQAIHGSNSNGGLIPVKKMIAGVWKDIGYMGEILSRLGINISEKLKLGIGSGDKTLFWKDVWVGSRSLAEEFPNIFKLAKIKNALVLDNYNRNSGGIDWKWEWIREPRSIQELNSYASIMSRLNQITLGLVSDRWIWKNDMGAEFSTKNLRLDILAAEMGQDIGPNFKWNSWAPMKSNLLLWRAKMDRVASKIGLERRGIHSIDTICNRCGYCSESTDHLFVECLFARSIWWNVLVWMRVPWPTNCESLNDLVQLLLDSPGSKKWKRIVYTVVMATVWNIWLARNRMVFDGKFIPVRRSVEAIKEDSFMWVSNRSNLPQTSWEKWSEFSVSNML